MDWKEVVVKRGTNLTLAGALLTLCGGLGCDPSAGSSSVDSTPSASFVAIDANTSWTCGLQPDGTPLCWGDAPTIPSDDGESEVWVNPPPAGPFTQLAVGWRHVCGVQTDGTVACWGAYNHNDRLTAPEGTFTELDAGAHHTCGVQTDGTVACWGRSYRCDWPNGVNNGCVEVEVGITSPPEGTFTTLSASEVHTCGVRTDGTLACWGDNEDGQSDAPTGTFKAVSTSSDWLWAYSCGVRADSTLACWGSPDAYAMRTPPPAGSFIAVATAGTFACALGAAPHSNDADATNIVCWGEGIASDPDTCMIEWTSEGGATTEVYGCDSGEYCRPDEDITINFQTPGVCINPIGEANSPPPGEFTDLTAGWGHMCALRDDKTVFCWGHAACEYDELGTCTPPS